MNDQNKTRAQLIAELQEIRQRVSEVESSASGLQRALQKLQEGEEQFRLIAQYAEDIIWTTDMELQITYVSPSLERALGYSSEEILALPPEQLLMPESLTDGIKAFREEVATAQTEPDPDYARVLEMEYRRKNGSTFCVEMKFSFLRAADGQLTGVLGVGRDISTRKQVEADLRAYARQTTLLNELTRLALEQSDLHETYQILADRLGELLQADGAYITLWDEHQQRTIPVTAYGSMREKYASIWFEPGEITMTESALNAGRVLAVEDMFNTPYLSRRVADIFPAHSTLVLPLIAGKQKLGAALIAFNQPHQFTQEEISLGEQTGRQIALVVARLRALQQAQRLAREQSLLFEAARDFASGLDEARVLSTVALHMTSALGVAGCTISRYEPKQERVVTMLDYDNSPGYTPEPVGTPYLLADYPVTHSVLECRQPLILFAGDPEIDPAERLVLEKFGYATVLMLPLAFGEQVFGLVELSRRLGEPPFSDEEIQMAQSLTSTAAVALENARLHAEVQNLAITDALTGLANRRALDRALDAEIARATRYGHSVALLFLDIDSFKQYNDTYGHPAGDDRLKALARLLRENVRHPDVIARYGGEEFIILLPHNDKNSALALGQRLRAAAEQAYHQASDPPEAPPDALRQATSGQPVSGYTVSIGVAACPEDAQTSKGLLRAADDAQRMAKRQGKNRVCIAPFSLWQVETN